MSRETRTGWAASVVLHAILLFLFFFISIPDLIQKQDFIEVTWGSPSIEAPRAKPTPAAAEPSATVPPSVVVPKKTPTKKSLSQPVILPERRIPDPSDDRNVEQKAERLKTPEQGAARKEVQEAGVGEREGLSGRTVGERERLNSSTATGSAAGVTPGPGGLGEGVEKGVAFSIQWTQGGTRRKISGDLPKYPDGVNVEAQIKILAVVLPDGSVQSTQPAQKANTKLEEAAMKGVRFWKFEPLRLSQPQSEQSCIVTFLFTLK